MQAQAQASEAANLADAEQLATMLGAAGLDAEAHAGASQRGRLWRGARPARRPATSSVAADDAKFAFTEVRLGIIPAVVSPFVLGKIGESAARRYFLTAETLTRGGSQGAGAGARSGARPMSSTPAARESCDALLKAAPGALAEAKTLIRDVAARTSGTAVPVVPPHIELPHPEAAARLARLRVQAEAQEGFNAFFAKRKASWRPD